MDKLKAWHSKSRLSFSGRPTTEINEWQSNQIYSVSADEKIVASQLQSGEDAAATIRRTPSFLKGRSSVALEDPGLPFKFKELFAKDSTEVLIKRYKCVYKRDCDQFIGKLYISNNFLCFVEGKKKLLKLVARLESIENFTANSTDVDMDIHGEVHNFSEFQSSGSAVAFLSSYLRLASRSSVDPVIFSVSSQTSSVGSLASSAQTSPASLQQTSTPNTHGNPGISPGLSPVKSSEDASDYKRSPVHRLNKSAIPSPLSIEQAVSKISDVAFRASCIPLLLLTRILSCGANGIISSLQLVSNQAAIRPPKAFTKVIAYAVLIFLGISMAYLYYRLETFKFPLSTPLSAQSGKMCHSDMDQLLLSLDSISKSMERTLQRLELDLR